jgi:hypothetical protein
MKVRRIEIIQSKIHREKLYTPVTTMIFENRSFQLASIRIAASTTSIVVVGNA